MAEQNQNTTSPAGIDSSERVERDTYDRGIVPAETAARREREGEEFKHLRREKVADGVDELAETGGYTIDNEGLTNAYAIEPEMYYETPGDARENISADQAQRSQELAEINQDNEGDLTMESDNRGKGTGVI
ncbi:hypothetical protein [Calothrix sp. NIES-3974]|uniref:hypothetical protein n=1 Tax=Calothrix sp. NIES-3974 TaxID=2005462 RepID=UPI000B5EE732|nr:hypothetical protein [Calothrix sp. NIES-3974]BAZ08014.1 hypothetical protein NIES3974_46820 [Calothrix sp. NIES-3974]